MFPSILLFSVHAYTAAEYVNQHFSIDGSCRSTLMPSKAGFQQPQHLVVQSLRAMSSSTFPVCEYARNQKKRVQLGEARLSKRLHGSRGYWECKCASRHLTQLPPQTSRSVFGRPKLTAFASGFTRTVLRNRPNDPPGCLRSERALSSCWFNYNELDNRTALDSLTALWVNFIMKISVVTSVAVIRLLQGWDNEKSKAT